uniref:Uncharacterized protein n=1 Tax=Romanomermis culicivorax TaxID=13658 RepID=A0A915J535_ROMCU
ILKILEVWHYDNVGQYHPIRNPDGGLITQYVSTFTKTKLFGQQNNMDKTIINNADSIIYLSTVDKQQYQNNFIMFSTGLSGYQLFQITNRVVVTVTNKQRFEVQSRSQNVFGSVLRRSTCPVCHILKIIQMPREKVSQANA